jgi:hypothetical protein
MSRIFETWGAQKFQVKGRAARLKREVKNAHAHFVGV